jgi:hypothetical protein
MGMTLNGADAAAHANANKSPRLAVRKACLCRVPCDCPGEVRTRPWPPLRISLRSSFRVVVGLVRDISVGGLGLLLTEPLAVGEQLAVFPSHPALGSSVARTARVVRVEAWSGHHWLVSCEFLQPHRQGDYLDWLA